MSTRFSSSSSGTKRPLSAAGSHRTYLYLSEKQIQHFLSTHAQSGCTEGTISQYRSALSSFYEFLPENKRIFHDTLPRWYDSMVEQGYSPRTASALLSAVNSLLEFLERRELQWYTKSDWREAETAALTRKEYIQLLQEAKRQENITLYLLVKTFALAGLSVQHLNDLTWEAVNRGAICTERKRYCQVVTLPDGLRQELLEHAVRNVVRSGPIFLAGSGKPLSRTTVTYLISRLGRDAGLEPGKANPRSLKGLYQNTFADYQRQADVWMKKRYAKLLEKEEAQAGWLAERR